MKKIIICSALLFAFFSCSKDQQTQKPVNPPSQTAIDFNSSLNLNIVRGTPVEGAKLKDDFGVFGYCDPKMSEDVIHAMESLEPDFMYNQKVDYVRNGDKFTYSPICYWPTHGWINFYAYTPYHRNSSDEFYHPKNSHDKGYPVIIYDVCKTVRDQEDLMVAQALKQVGTSCTVHFDFHHVLTKVGVEAYLDSNCDDADNLTVYIKKVEFKKIKDHGEFYYSHLNDASKEDWWQCVEGSHDYNIGLKENHHLMGDDADNSRPRFDGVILQKGKECMTQVNADNQYLLAIPQCFEGNCSAVLEVTYCIYDGKNTRENKVEIPLKDTQCWTPGACIDYIICIQLNTVKFDVEITPWQDCEEIETCVTPSTCNHHK